MIKDKSVNNQKMFTLEVIIDSECAGDTDTHISVYGCTIYFCGASLDWEYKSCKSATLSSIHRSWVFRIVWSSKGSNQCETRCGLNGLQKRSPIMIDNVGAIYLAKNHTTSHCTKHIDIRQHFARENNEDCILKVIILKSEDNDADILTENTTEEILHKHAKKVEKAKKENNTWTIGRNNHHT
jgi:hypothetical protein